jgi:bifunctional non-homologous end joining protein LigD
MNTSSEIWQLGSKTLRVSHLEKLYWPQTGVTKGEMLQYYRQIAPVLLPYFKDRPVTLRLFPEGVTGPSYYMREYPARAPNWLRSVQYQPRTLAHPIRLPLIDDTAGLLWFANEGAIEFHLWGSHVPDLATPDQAIFDLDPGEAATFADVRAAALRLHDALERVDVRGYVKTSGRRGLHVYVPLAAGYSFEQVRGWVKEIGQQLATSYPDLITTATGSTHRGKSVAIDAAQNSIGRNTAAPYTLRASITHPTVSTPLSWEELENNSILSLDLTPQVVLQRLLRLGDLFAPALQADQRLL